jgi:hypothetical protein
MSVSARVSVERGCLRCLMYDCAIRHCRYLQPRARARARAIIFLSTVQHLIKDLPPKHVLDLQQSKYLDVQEVRRQGLGQLFLTVPTQNAS